VGSLGPGGGKVGGAWLCVEDEECSHDVFPILYAQPRVSPRGRSLPALYDTIRCDVTIIPNSQDIRSIQPTTLGCDGCQIFRQAVVEKGDSLGRR